MARYALYVEGQALLRERTSRPSDGEQRQRRLRARWLVSAFFLFVGLIAFLESPLTRVRGVDVSGNATIPGERIVKEANVYRGMNLWQVNGARVGRSVTSAEPFVESVKVKTDYLHGIVHLVVQEKHVVAVLDDSGKWYTLLNDGVVYEPLTSGAGLSWPIITVDGGTKPILGHVVSSAIETLCAQLGGLSSQALQGISEFHVDPFGEVTIFLENHFSAQCNLTNVRSVISELNSVIHYFSSRGYGPGTIDMTGQPPYRYTPFSPGTQGVKP